MALNGVPLLEFKSVAKSFSDQKLRKFRALEDVSISLEQSEFADSYPKTLSGGMRQRMALARSMIMNPKLLLLDEPFGALDEHTRERMQQLLLRTVAASSCSIVIVTHDIREAILLSDRVIQMSPRPGTVQNVFSSPLSKPRSRDQMKTPEFIALHQEIVGQLRE